MARLADNREPEEVFDAAVRTLAEFYYECGFEPEWALDMAWDTALAPDDASYDWREEYV